MIFGLTFQRLKSTNQCETHPKAGWSPSSGNFNSPPHRPWRRWGVSRLWLLLPCPVEPPAQYSLSVLVLGLGGAQFLWGSVHPARRPCVVGLTVWLAKPSLFLTSVNWAVHCCWRRAAGYHGSSSEQWLSNMQILTNWLSTAWTLISQCSFLNCPV